jgi:hypothetical protein
MRPTEESSVEESGIREAEIVSFNLDWSICESNVAKILTSWGHQIDEQSWVKNKADEGRLIWCSNESCRKLFQVTLIGGTNIAWNIGQLIVKEDEEHLYRRGIIILFNDIYYNVSHLKRGVKPEFFCSRYINFR